MCGNNAVIIHTEHVPIDPETQRPVFIETVDYRAKINIPPDEEIAKRIELIQHYENELTRNIGKDAIQFIRSRIDWNRKRIAQMQL